MNSEGYRKELQELENNKNVLEKAIRERVNDLIKANPDVMYNNNPVSVYTPNFIRKYTITFALIIMKQIEDELESKHPHKQTEINFD